MNMTAAETKFADKINALLAKAESTTHPAEAEAYTAMAEKLMIKWGIEDAKLEAAKKGKATNGEADKIVKVTRDWHGQYNQAQDMIARWIARGLSASNKCLVSKGKNHTQTWIIGFESDVKRAEQLIDSLIIQADDALRQWWKIEKKARHYTDMEGWKARRQFLISFGNAVGARLIDARDAEVKSAGAGTDLVLVNREDRVNQFLAAEFGPLRASRGHLQGDANARVAGHRAGLNANLHRGSVES